MNTYSTYRFAALASLALAASPFVISPASAAPPTIVVNSDLDNEFDGNMFCTLREAINNAQSKPDTTSGDCARGKGKTRRITFDPSIFSIPRTIMLGSALPTITGLVAIEGPGAALLTIDADTKDRHIWVNGGTLDLSGVRLINANASASGGAIRVDIGGTLNVTDSVFDHNTSTSSGGAISVLSSTANIGHSTFYDNDAPRGGAIYHQNGTLVVTDSMFFDNMSLTRGGAIEHFTTQTGEGIGTLIVQHSTFLDNDTTVSNDGGAIGVFGNTSGTAGTATTDITGSTIVGNTAVGDGGGVSNHVHVATANSTMTVIDSVVVQNTAGGSGHDINNKGGVTAVLIVENTIVDICNDAGGGCPTP